MHYFLDLKHCYYYSPYVIDYPTYFLSLGALIRVIYKRLRIQSAFNSRSSMDHKRSTII